MIQKLGQYLLLAFIGFLPWSVVISVFWTEQLHIELFRFLKEGWIFVILGLWIFDAIRKKNLPKFDILDYLIFGYIASLIVVSLAVGSTLSAIIYGLRYDAEFLLVFIFIRQLTSLWEIPFQRVANVFLISGGIMLLWSLAIRYIFSETILTVAGFSGQVSVWDESGPPPIFHGIPGASVVRFQWMLEWPNQMAFFLLVYIGTFFTQFFHLRKYRFINTIILAILLFLLLQTYSRSGMLGAIIGTGLAVIVSLTIHIRKRWWNYVMRHVIGKKIFVVLGVWVVIAGVFAFQFWPKFGEIITRSGSTSAHFERMYIGYQRFLQAPFWHGLAEAGPASRAIAHVNQAPVPFESLNPEMAYLSDFFLERNPNFVFNTEHYYIPESWYIQQLIEGGFVSLLLFLSIFAVLLWKVRKFHAMFGVIISVLVMNTFLHSFESVHTSLAFFSLLASLLPKNTD